MKNSLHTLFDWLIPVAILFAVTLIFWTTNLDLAVERLFFDASHGWLYKDAQPWKFLYQYGTIPALAAAAAALIAYIWSFWQAKIAPYRKSLLFLALLMAIGPGLIVNTVFKQNWGRPRPRNIQEFGGNAQFLKVWQKGADKKGNSFPSGHASTGFYWLAPFFLLRKRSKIQAIIWLCVGLSSGMIIGLARMIQGGHFLSDVIWAGGFVYLCGLGLAYLLRPEQNFLPIRPAKNT